MNAILPISYYTVLEALRNRLLWVVLGMAFAAWGLTAFVGELAITETREIQVSLLAWTLRLGAVFLVCLFVASSQAREFEDKGVELLLAFPMPRAAYYFGKLGGYVLTAWIISLCYGAITLLYASPAQALLWAMSLGMELMLVTALTLLLTLTFAQVTAAVAFTLAGYALARSIGALQLMAQGPLYDPSSHYQMLMARSVDLLAYLLPSLDRYTQTQWLVYSTGEWKDALWIVAQTAVYLLLLAGAALVDLYRKPL